MKKNGYVSFILAIICIGFLWFPLNVSADDAFDMCVYREGSKYIGVPPIGNPTQVCEYDFAESTQPTANCYDLHTDARPGLNPIFRQPSCPNLFKYEYGGQTKYTSTSCDELIESTIILGSKFEYENWEIECPFLDDQVVIYGYCGSALDPFTFAGGKLIGEAIDTCARRLLFNDIYLTSTNKNFDETAYAPLSRDEVGDLISDEILEDYEEKAEKLDQCLLTNHPTEYENCKDRLFGETINHKECVKEEVELAGGTFQCDNEYNDWEEVRDDLRNVNELMWVRVNLKELTCDELFGDDMVLRDFLEGVFFVMVAIGLAILITMGVLDYANVVGSSGEDAEVLKKANSRFLKRVGVFLLLILLPVIIILFLEVFGPSIGIHNTDPFCR